MSLDRRYYILVGHLPVPATIEQWEIFFGDIDKRRVDETIIGELRVSTIFLGLDHNFFGDGPPLLFETMIFSQGHPDEGGADLRMSRCSTWDEAERMHAAAVVIAAAWVADGAMLAGVAMGIAASPLFAEDLVTSAGTIA